MTTRPEMDEYRRPKTPVTITLEHGLYKQLFFAAKQDNTSMNKLGATAIHQFLSEREERLEKTEQIISELVQQLFNQDPTGEDKLWYDERLDEDATRKLEMLCRSERARRFADTMVDDL